MQVPACCFVDSDIPVVYLEERRIVRGMFSLSVSVEVRLY